MEKSSGKGERDMKVGTIKEIIRHPVKSFGGESVAETRLMSYGLYGDRSHAFLDTSRPGKFLTITQAPEMATFSARFAGKEQDNMFPAVIIRMPDGSSAKWGDPRVAGYLESLTGKKTEQIQYSPKSVPLGPIEEEHLQLVSAASLRKLGEMRGREVDHRRFRANIILDIEGSVPFAEESWFGKKLIIGSGGSVIMIKRHCERCQIITVDPEDAGKDAALLKMVAKERSNHFGVYASVVRTGPIRTGDAIYLAD